MDVQTGEFGLVQGKVKSSSQGNEEVMFDVAWEKAGDVVVPAGVVRLSPNFVKWTLISPRLSKVLSKFQSPERASKR